MKRRRRFLREDTEIQEDDEKEQQEQIDGQLHATFYDKNYKTDF